MKTGHESTTQQHMKKHPIHDAPYTPFHGLVVVHAIMLYTA